MAGFIHLTFSELTGFELAVHGVQLTLCEHSTQLHHARQSKEEEAPLWTRGDAVSGTRIPIKISFQSLVDVVEITASFQNIDVLNESTQSSYLQHDLEYATTD